MTFNREEKDGCALLSIEGPMTVNDAAALRDEMVACFNDYEGLILDLHEVSKCDTAGIQLLCSAKLTAERTDKSFNVTRASLSSMSALERAGFDPHVIMGTTEID